MAIPIKILSPLLVLSALSSEAQTLDPASLPSQGYQQVAAFPLPLDGSEAHTPNLSLEKSYVLVIAGTFAFSYDGRSYDARWATGRDGAFSDPHSYVEVSPSTLVLAGESKGHHRYAYTLPSSQPGSLGVRLAFSRLVDDFVIPPSQIRKSLSGKMTAELWERNTITAGSLWSWMPYGILAFLMVLVGLIAVIRRRNALQGQVDGNVLLRRIQRKNRHLLAEMARSPHDFSALRGKMEEMVSQCANLVSRLESFRSTANRTDQKALLAERSSLEQRLAQATDEALRRDLQATLEEKVRGLELLEQTRTQASRYWTRLERVEAIIDSARLRLPNILAMEDRAAERDTMREIEGELRIQEEVFLELGLTGRESD